MIKPGLYGGSRSLLRDFVRDFDTTCLEAAKGGYSETWVIRHLQTLGYELGEEGWNGWTRIKHGKRSGLLNVANLDTKELSV